MFLQIKIAPQLYKSTLTKYEIKAIEIIKNLNLQGSGDLSRSLPDCSFSLAGQVPGVENWSGAAGCRRQRAESLSGPGSLPPQWDCRAARASWLWW